MSQTCSITYTHVNFAWRWLPLSEDRGLVTKSDSAYSELTHALVCKGEKMRLIVAVFLMIFSSISFAEDKALIHITATSDDFVGKQLVYHLRESIRSSHGMKLADSIDHAFVRIKVVTLNPDEQNSSQNQTVYSIVWTIKQFDSTVESYWTHYVGVCGRSRTKECATELVSQTDEIVSAIREAFAEVVRERY